MKVKSIFFLLSILLALNSSCRRDTEDVIDCVTEAFFVGLTHSVDPGDSKKINFQINYSGAYAVTSVDWDYGDGNSESINGTTAVHTYQQAGSFTVRAKVNIKNGSATCTIEPEKTITVN